VSGRVAAAFARAAAAGRAAFVPYLTGLFPDAERSLAAARVLARHGDVLEIGLAYSDPLGDGPTIQRSSEAALAAGATTAGTFDLVRRLRAESEVPIALMTYYNPVYGYHGGGEEGFVAAAKAAGVDALILPDLPPDEGEELIAAARRHDLDTVFLVAPTSTDARLARVTRDCRGFVYAVSVTGVTGARRSVPEEVGALVDRTRAAGGLPVAVGFGVGDAESAARIAALADGVVVGSALVDRVARIASGDDAAGLAALDGFAAALAAACVR
jgi:tryptophan synthase alpha chain